MNGLTDWADWHSPYDDPSSPLSRRLAVVQGHIDDWIDETTGPVTAVSVCAGDGRDLLGILASRSDADRVTGTLVELDPRLVQRALTTARNAELTNIEVRRADAGTSDAYLGAVPADLVLLCGVLGNIDDSDVRRVVEVIPQLCRPGATVVWTRHTRHPDLTPQIRAWFADAGFEELGFTAPEDVVYSVGVHRLIGSPQTLQPGARLFRFVR